MTQLEERPGVRWDFDRTTTLAPIGEPGVSDVTLDAAWSSLVGIHGGYLCAIAVVGAEAQAPDRSVRTITTSFLRTGVSIDLTTHVHRPSITLGEDEWLTGTFEVRTSSGGLAVEHGVLATEDGTLVAESFQTRRTTGA
jgi:acyl-CoA thioesterase